MAALLCLLLLAGCGGGSEPTGTPEVTPAPDMGSEPVPGGSITISMPEGTKLGNPLTAATRELNSIYGLVFESLLELDETGNPVPCLAETWESEDGLTWTFKLRTGVKWQETGRALDANDIKFTMDQIKELGKDMPWYYITNYIKTWDAGADGTFVIELKKPFYGVLQALTFPVLPAEYGYENGGAPATPVGTGPYKVTGQQEKEIDLAVNADWWKKPPYITDIKAVAYPDNATAVSTLVLGGQLDAVQTEDLTVAQYKESGVANVYEYRTRYLEFMAFNFGSQDVREKLIRQAIAYAIDRSEIVSYTYVNHATVADTPVPPESWLYDGKVIKYSYNVDEAKRLIKLAGWEDNYDAEGKPGTDGYWDTSPDGTKRNLTLTLLTNRDENNTIRNDAANLMADQMAKAGIKVEIQAESWDDYKNMIKEKRFDIVLTSCYLSPIPDYRFLLGTGGLLNIGGYSSSEMDTLLDKVIESPKSDSLKVNIAALQNAIIDELPIMCLYFRTHSLLTSTGLKSVTGSVSGAREESAFAKISQWYVPQ